MKHLVTMAEQKGCHGSEMEMVPRNISVPIAHGDTGAKRKRADVWNMLEMVEGSRLPGSHGLVAWKTSDNTDMVQTKGASHPTCIHAFTGVDSGLYLQSVQKGRFSFGAK